MRAIHHIAIYSLAVFSAATVCADGVITQTYELNDFSRVVLNGSHELEVGLGDYSVQVQGMQDGDTLISRDNDTLFLGRSQQGLDYDEPVKFRVSLPLLERVTLRGAGSVFVRSMRTDDSLNFELQGSGSVYIHPSEFSALTVVLGGSGDVVASELKVERLVANIAGAGAIQIGTLDAGSTMVSIGGSGDFGIGEDCFITDDVTVNIAGSGDFNGESCTASATMANIIGSGDVRIGNSSRIDANIVGSGSVYYRTADTTSASILGSGELEQLN